MESYTFTEDGRLKCGKCGHSNEAHSTGCRYCTNTWEPAPQPNSDSNLASAIYRAKLEKDSEYKGVGGWLLLLCVGLTILGPLRILITLIQGYSASSLYFERFPGLKFLVGVDFIFSPILIGLSIHAGLSLWQIKPNAVKIARRFIYISLGYLALSAVLPFTAGLPSEANSAMSIEVMKGIAQGVISAVIWLSYLSNSKRVRATFADA